MLALGHEEIVRRRAAREGDALYIHEKVSKGGVSYSFVPAVRFSVCTEKPDNIRVKAATLALFAENSTSCSLARTLLTGSFGNPLYGGITLGKTLPFNAVCHHSGEVDFAKDMTRHRPLPIYSSR